MRIIGSIYVVKETRLSGSVSTYGKQDVSRDEFDEARCPVREGNVEGGDRIGNDRHVFSSGADIGRKTCGGGSLI